jgi:hypothetical protein
MPTPTEIKIRVYKQKDHEIVNEIFVDGMMEQVRPGILNGFNGSKPGSIIKLITAFVIGTWMTSSVLIGIVNGIIYGFVYAWSVYNLYDQYIK